MGLLPTSDLSWSDEFLIGDPAMDAMHQEFVTRVEALATAEDARVTSELNLLANHLHDHFESENALMLATAFPPRRCHVEEHSAVLRSVEGVRRRVLGGDEAAARRLGEELSRWFPLHVTHLDSALAQWLFKHRHGGKPLLVRRHIRSIFAASTPINLIGDRSADSPRK